MGGVLVLALVVVAVFVLTFVGLVFVFEFVAGPCWHALVKPTSINNRAARKLVVRHRAQLRMR
jgi:hypothetical protein